MEVERFAARQAGRVHYQQLREAGLSPRRVGSWNDRGIITRTAPQVYALGSVRTDAPALLWQAVLYAGPGACLTGASAAHLRGLISFAPRHVTVATSRRCRSLPGVRVLQNRTCRRGSYGGLPIAVTEELILELAADGNVNVVRRAIEVLDYRRELDLASLWNTCRRGRTGSRLVKRALVHRLPQLAHAKSPLEIDFLLLLEAHHLLLPKVNVTLHGIEVDCFFEDLGLAVELDGRANHGTAAQLRRDVQRTSTLRARGLNVIRFRSDDVYVDTMRTLATLIEHGVGRQPAAR